MLGKKETSFSKVEVRQSKRRSRKSKKQKRKEKERRKQKGGGGLKGGGAGASAIQRASQPRTAARAILVATAAHAPTYHAAPRSAPAPMLRCHPRSSFSFLARAASSFSFFLPPRVGFRVTPFPTPSPLVGPSPILVCN